MMSPSKTDRCARAAGVTLSANIGAWGRIPPHRTWAIPTRIVTPTKVENNHPWRKRSHGSENT